MLNPADLQDVPPQSLARAEEMVAIAQRATAAQVIAAPDLLAAMCDMQNFRFLVDGAPVPSVAVLSEDVLFPAVAWVAHKTGRELMEADLGYRFEADAQALLGVRVSGPPVTAHTADLFRALFLMDACTAMFGVLPQASVEITALTPQLRDLLAATLPQARALPIPAAAAQPAIAQAN